MACSIRNGVNSSAGIVYCHCICKPERGLGEHLRQLDEMLRLRGIIIEIICKSCQA